MCMSSDSPDVPEAGPMERTMVDLSERQLQDYEQMYDPLARKMVDDSKELGTAAFRQHTGNVAAAAARQQSGTVNASAGSAPLLKQGLVEQGIGKDMAVGGAVSQGDMLSKSQEVVGKLGMAQLGRGQSQTASQTFGNVAANEYAENIAEANADASKSAARSSAAGTVAGIGAGYWLTKPQTPSVNMQGQKKPLYDNPAFIKNF
ncbi:hypothetical protein NX722_28340 [Endozoicomonas gorgoniicola]|uniref:Uncharacterized protein n=1 Tax=Endozoicomonas gorgoniicola TaxID=1234144 RepID=A0ABT3MNX2_9GAMM|nr:hypothetical protein [Endozoicomonas gorgoniicola]MCW7551072.1 hypothetical protein [Endozoicomonas gorgoniicola]MCW7556476.1 hypothetical protein [Endozoicomonas gorgoniicola]